MTQIGGKRRRLLLRWLWGAMPVFLRRRLARHLNDRFNVSAVGVFFNEEGRILLLRHVMRSGSGWGLPGGFLRKREDPRVGLARELREETGLACEDLRLVDVTLQSHGVAYELAYCAIVPGVQELHPNIEIFEGQWVSPGALPGDLPASQRRYVEAAVQLRKGGVEADPSALTG